LIKIIADSGCDFTQEMIKKESINISQIPLTLQLGNNIYIDDLKLNIKDFVEEMKKYKKERKTAAPSPQKYYEEYKTENDVFVITLSSKLSSSYNNANIAKKMYIEDYGNKNIQIIDSKSASIGETLIALKLNELSNLGLKSDEITKEIIDFRNNQKTYFVLECYDNLVNTGRLNPYAAKLASFLSIVPICGAEDGSAVLKGQARGHKNAVSKLIEIIMKESSDFEQKILGISHVQCYQKAVELRDKILEKIHFKSSIIVPASGLCSNYADDQGIIISF